MFYFRKFLSLQETKRLLIRAICIGFFWSTVFLIDDTKFAIKFSGLNLILHLLFVFFLCFAWILMEWLAFYKKERILEKHYEKENYLVIEKRLDEKHEEYRNQN